jgi:hypothetical protein
MFKKQIASKEQVKLMIGLCGPSGSGKTYSALQLAYGITDDWSKIALADTENRSALYYAGETTGNWQHIGFDPAIKGGYHPNNWVSLINFAESDPNIEVLILDSISHEWVGSGGCLQLVEAYSRAQKGNTFTPWKIVTPLHDAFFDKMRTSRLHIIATMRANSEYSLEKNEHGKTTPRKVGLKPVQREGVDYEFGVMFDIDISHYASASKDRTNIFSNQAPFLINPAVGESLRTWARDAPAPEKNSSPAVIEMPKPTLRELFAKEGITEADLIEFIGKPFEERTTQDLEELKKAYHEISAGNMSREDFLEHAKLRKVESNE